MISRTECANSPVIVTFLLKQCQKLIYRFFKEKTLQCQHVSQTNKTKEGTSTKSHKFLLKTSKAYCFKFKIIQMDLHF